MLQLIGVSTRHHYVYLAAMNMVRRLEHLMLVLLFVEFQAHKSIFLPEASFCCHFCVPESR